MNGPVPLTIAERSPEAISLSEPPFAAHPSSPASFTVTVRSGATVCRVQREVDVAGDRIAVGVGQPTGTVKVDRLAGVRHADREHAKVEAVLRRATRARSSD